MNWKIFVLFCLMHSFSLPTRPDLGLPSLPRHLIVELKYRAPSLHLVHLSVFSPPAPSTSPPLHLASSPSTPSSPRRPLLPPSSSHSALNKTDEKNNRFFIALIRYLISNLLGPAIPPPPPRSAQFNFECVTQSVHSCVCVCVRSFRVINR